MNMKTIMLAFATVSLLAAPVIAQPYSLEGLTGEQLGKELDGYKGGGNTLTKETSGSRTYDLPDTTFSTDLPDVSEPTNPFGQTCGMIKTLLTGVWIVNTNCNPNPISGYGSGGSFITTIDGGTATTDTCTVTTKTTSFNPANGSFGVSSDGGVTSDGSC